LILVARGSSGGLRLRAVKKVELIRKIVEGLAQSLEVLEKAARASHAEATHESSKAESKYDTRGLEAAYLAGGQARQAKEILGAMEVYGALVPKDFGPADPIDLTALVELESDGQRAFYFVGPRSGGLEVEYQRKEITVVTPASPLGQNLVGKKAGAAWTAKTGGFTNRYKIISVR
jgi:transcription elongation GreA/GreB family factor